MRYHPSTRPLRLATLLLAAPLILTGCNTVRGIGLDLQHAGRAIENTADRFSTGPQPPAQPDPPRHTHRHLAHRR